MFDFFEILSSSNCPDECDALQFIEQMSRHRQVLDSYSTEELYSQIVIVSRDLSLNVHEMGLWWGILEAYWKDYSIEMVTLLYCTAFAAKEKLGSSEYITRQLIDKNYVEGFASVYSCWISRVNIDVVFEQLRDSLFLTIPKILQKDVNYNTLVGFLTSRDDLATLKEVNLPKEESEKSRKARTSSYDFSDGLDSVISTSLGTECFDCSDFLGDGGESVKSDCHFEFEEIDYLIQKGGENYSLLHRVLL